MNTTAFNESIAELINYLDERWELQQLNDATFQFKYITNPGIPMDCVAWINPQLEAFFFRVILPLPITANVRPVMAEYITRVNYPMPVGSFALDFETGDLRFKSGVYFGGLQLSRSLIQHVVLSSLEFVDAHILGIVYLVTGETLARALAANAENPAGDVIRPPFESFIVGYLKSLFLAAGVDDVTSEEINEFQAELEKTSGSQYLFGGYDGVHKHDLNEQAMRKAYENGSLRFSASQTGMNVIRAYKEKILRRRSK